MKRILITGANSFIGMAVSDYLMKWPELYSVETIDMLNSNWEKISFKGVDVVYHVAGIAHSDHKQITKEEKKMYYKVNTELAIRTATKAKQEGVKQFIFMSSAIVYGESSNIGEEKIIYKDTPVSPTNYYSDSKVRAENGLFELDNECFNICILRPPMIYGRGCKGNYKTLSNIAKKTIFFPKIANYRSMLYIGNLVEFVKLMIDNCEKGIFWPQNSEYTNTSELVKQIAKCNGKRVILVPGFSMILKVLSKRISLINKAFGNLTYDKSMSLYAHHYTYYSIEDSIKETEE